MRRQSRGELRRLRKLAEIRAQEKKREKKRRQSLIHLLAIGEGTEIGPAYKRAKKARQMKRRVNIVAVDIRRPNYTPPENMKFLVADALEYLENIPPCTVKRITDYAAFEVITMGKYGQIPGGAKEYYKIILASVKSGQPLPSNLPNVAKMSDKYAKLAMRALVPGGKFTVITMPEQAAIIAKHLEKAGFKAELHQMTRKEVLRSGSLEAKSNIELGQNVSKIVATKPS